jgi:hypothetical protein
MNQNQRHATRVGAEWLGKARVFRWEVEKNTDRFKAELLQLTLPIIRRLQRHPRLRRPTELDAIRLWQRMNLPYRFTFEFGRDIHNTLWIQETRLDSLSLRFVGWEDWEPGVGITQMRMTTHKQMIFEGTPLVIISLHALARYMERSGTKDYATLLNDLRPLLEYTGQSERIATTSGGEWIGDRRVIATNGMDRTFPVRAIRTYIQTPLVVRHERRQLKPGYVPTQQLAPATS